LSNDNYRTLHGGRLPFRTMRDFLRSIDIRQKPFSEEEVPSEINGTKVANMMLEKFN
jgi:hypothetical protein